MKDKDRKHKKKRRRDDAAEANTPSGAAAGDDDAEASRSDDAGKGDEGRRDDIANKVESTAKKSKKKSKKSTKEERHRERLEKKAAKKAEKEALMAKVPTKDEHGIAYTKVQIKRMMKRVKRGLHPVPTEKEERERERQERIERRREEEELAGMLFSKDDEGDEQDGQSDVAKKVAIDDAGKESDEESDEGADGRNDANVDASSEDGTGKAAAHTTATNVQPQKKKPRRKKPVPDDYTCQACKNRHMPRHWIYDCPDKVTMRGTNAVSKKYRGLHDPASRKVFVSGLPFDAKKRAVEMYFQEKTGGSKVVFCKLLTFEDTGRCKGQAFITFETDDGAKKAMKLSGEVLDLGPSEGEGTKKKGKTKDAMSGAKKELKLKVSKVLSRAETKKNVK